MTVLATRAVTGAAAAPAPAGTVLAPRAGMRTLPIVLVALVLAIGAACASARTQRRSTTISAAEGSAGGAEPAQIVDLDGGVVVGPPDAGVAPLPLPDAGGAVPLVAP